MTRVLQKVLLTGCAILMIALSSRAQTNSVEFGKNRLQFKNFKWRYYQSPNFNVYFSQHGLAVGKYVVQEAETQLPPIEKFMDYGLRRRINIIVYNNYGEEKQTNIGISQEWQNTGGVTQLVGDKMIVYFNGDHNNLQKQIRQGIAKVILDNMIFGDDISEFAGNAVLLDLPKWYTDGFIAYTAENWSAVLDDQLKLTMMTGRYRTFNQLAYDMPTLAGHAFWYYVERSYGKDAVSYLLYMSRIERSLKKATKKVLHKSLKKTMQDFITFYQQQYREDNRRRRQYTRGTVATTKDVSKRDYYKFHPSPRNRTDYAVVKFNKGIYKVLLYQGYYNPKVLLSSGVRQFKSQINPNYPLITWNSKGSRIAIVYEERGKLKLFIYDLISKAKIHQALPQFESINDIQYIPDYNNTFLLSAVNDGHTDLYTFDLGAMKTKKVTDDIYDELDPSFVSFPGKSGIIFTSNRPSAYAGTGDTVLPHDHYNVFLVSNYDNPKEAQITQLTSLKNSDAHWPSQYDDTHFSFVSSENGVANRYAGFFTTRAAGADSLFFIGTEVLRNPDPQELDSALQDYGTSAPDSVSAVAITNDSTYVFPLTNYSYGIQESNVAGDQHQISDVIQLGDFKRDYRLKTDERTLQRRNVSTRPTHFRQYEQHQDSISRGKPQYYQQQPDTSKPSNNDFFQSQFGYQPPDTNLIIKQNLALEQRQKEKKENLLNKIKLFPYHLKFSSDYLVTQLDNSVLITRYQQFTGGGGPIYLQQPFNGLIKLGVTDLLEDYKFSGGFRIPSNFNGSEYFFSYENLKHYVDWKLLYYRKVSRVSFQNAPPDYQGKLKTNLYQASFTYPFDEVKSVRADIGVRTDRTLLLASDPVTLEQPDLLQTYGLLRVSYVYDNTINPATNIWFGTRYKIYAEMFPQLNKAAGIQRKYSVNLGLDARHYVSIYKNFIWATRLAADYSLGNQKVLFYLGGVDNWQFPKYNDNNPVPQDKDYAYQTLEENLRGYKQNIKNGSKVVLLNTELRLPVFATFIKSPITSEFIRNFQVTSFIDIGTAWNDKLSFSKDDNYLSYSNDAGDVIVKLKNNFLGPFAGGYGFGARTKLLGYFVRADAAWPMTAFFKGKPMIYLALGVDF